MHSGFWFLMCVHLQQAVQEPLRGTGWLSDHLGAVNLWLSSISKLECLHCAGPFSSPMASQDSLTQKALDVQLLPLSPTAKYQSATEFLGGAKLDFLMHPNLICIHKLHISKKVLQIFSRSNLESSKYAFS